MASVRTDLPAFTDAVTARIGELAGDLAEPLRSAIGDLARSPGKGLRPMLLRACAGSGAPDPVRLARLGAVVELLHLASLLHDDMIDRAAVRRGGPAAHTVIGSELATLAGLACFAMAGMEAADLGEGAARLVSEAVAALSYGELLDVERAFDIRLMLPDYLELVERKTGELFRLCCLLGAAEGRAGPETVATLAAFGRDFGVAFQILDDCLDLVPGDTGKPSGTDHLLGLFGAPTLYALAADGSGKLAALLVSPALRVGDMGAVRELVTAYGGLDAAERLARDRYERALSTLGRLADPEVRDLVADAAGLAWRGRA